MKLYSYCKKQVWLWLALGLFLAAAFYINPLRQGAISDDWSYALTVKHLVETGTYRLNEWASANILFQAYWGSLFATVLGYSYASLRLSTVVLAFAGLTGFYFLAKEHRFSSFQAGLLSLGWLSNPLVLLLTFSFMTDIPFLALLVIALTFYTRAIRLKNYPLMFCGSLAAVATILIRPTGLALLAGLFCAWFFNKERKSLLALYLTGVVLPVLTGGFVVANFLQPGLSARYNSAGQAEYFANPLVALGETLLLRPLSFLHYLAFFMTPLVLIGLIIVYGKVKQLLKSTTKDKATYLNLRLLGVVIGFFFFSMVYSFITKDNMLMPYYGWHLNNIIQNGSTGRLFITAFTLLGGIMLDYIFLRRFWVLQEWKILPVQERLLDYVTLFLLLYHLLFFQIGDRYLLVLLPFCLITLGRYLGNQLVRFRMAALLSCIGMLLVSIIWVRGSLVQLEAHWLAGEQVTATGIDPGQVGVSWTWLAYYKFDDYLVETRAEKLQPLDLLERWYGNQLQHASFLVIENEVLPPEEKWHLLFELSYQDGLFRERRVQVMKRD